MKEMLKMAAVVLVSLVVYDKVIKSFITAA
jgi:hypothetical protein